LKLRKTNMSGSTAEAESPEEMGRRKFLACACGILATPLTVVIGYPLAASWVGTIYKNRLMTVHR
jgi:hypothetical protein